MLTVKSAIDYLRGNGPKPGAYTLVQTGGYATLRGMMTWSINWDAVASCGSAYEYALNFQSIFGTTTSIVTNDNSEKLFSVFPNPASDFLHFNNSNHLNSPTTIRIYNTLGEIVFSKVVARESETINISNFPNGIYFLRITNAMGQQSQTKLVKQ